MLSGGSWLYQTSAVPANVRWKALHFKAVDDTLRLICVMYLLKYFSESSFPSYFEILGGTKSAGIEKFRISLENGRLSSSSRLVIPIWLILGWRLRCFFQIPQSTKIFFSLLFGGEACCAYWFNPCSCWANRWTERTLPLGFCPIRSKTLTDLQSSYSGGKFPSKWGSVACGPTTYEETSPYLLFNRRLSSIAWAALAIYCMKLSLSCESYFWHV